MNVEPRVRPQRNSLKEGLRDLSLLDKHGKYLIPKQDRHLLSINPGQRMEDVISGKTAFRDKTMQMGMLSIGHISPCLYRYHRPRDRAFGQACTEELVYLFQEKTMNF